MQYEMQKNEHQLSVKEASLEN